MNSDAAMLYNILNQDIRSCTITLLNPYNQAEHFSFRLSVDDAATYRIDDSKTPYRIYVSQPLGIEFLGSRVPDGFDTAEQLFAFANTALEAELTQFFFDISHIKKADIMKIGECYKKRFLTQYDWENMNWSKLYETAEFNVDIYNSAVFQGARVQNNTA